MKTHILRSRRFASGCVVALLLPWGGTCGEDAASSPQEPSLGTLIRRIDKVQEKGIAYDNANPPSSNWGGWTTLACQLVGEIEKLGDRAALPFLEEKSLMTNAPATFRSRAAITYIKIADAGESVNLMRKLYDDHSLRSWYGYVSNFFLQKVKTEEESLTEEVKRDICTHLLAIVQSADIPGDARNADRFLLDRVPEYANSRQRATLVRYANTGTEYTTNTFNPIKAHFDNIPPKQRIDLRKRFPDLPPLPGDAPAGGGSPVKVAIAVVAGVVTVVTTWFAVRWKKAHKTT
jgi:hypothetical protein